MEPIKSILFTTLSSTNDWAKQHLDQCPRKALTAIRTEEQTAGRGRMGRPWYSPKGKNLYLTLVWFPEEDSSIDPLTVTHLLAYSMIEVLPNLPCKIKWPNDLLCRDKKIAGILCENVLWQEHQAFVLGIGVNVQMDDMSAIDQPATSIFLETGELYSIAELSEQLIARFQHNLSRHLSGYVVPFLDCFCILPPIKERASASQETTNH